MRKRATAATAATAMTACALAACAAATDGRPGAPALPDLPPALTRAVQDDAAARARVAAGQVRITRVDAVTWSDGSLGCPEPGLAYTQALVPGWRIRVDAGGRHFDYHASRRGGWRWCPPGRAVEPLPGDAVL